MNQPEQRFSAGGISASVWRNERKNSEGEAIEVRSVTFQKRYKDKDGEWKSTTSMHDRDLPNALVVLAKAYEYLKLKISTPEMVPTPELA